MTDFSLQPWMHIGDSRTVARSSQRASRKEGRARTPEERRIAQLEEAVDRLQLANVALWELVSEKLSVDEAELRRRIEATDLTEGAAARPDDGLRSTCQECGGENRAARGKCLYCGAWLPEQPKRWESFGVRDAEDSE